MTRSTPTQPPADRPGVGPACTPAPARRLTQTKVDREPARLGVVIASLLADLDQARAAGNGPRTDKLRHSLAALDHEPLTPVRAGG